MKADIVGIMGACAYALDCIEAELVNITNKHGKRVAYISVCMAEAFDIKKAALQDLAVCALLHDNALTQYISEELKWDWEQEENVADTPHKLGVHCAYGEKNISRLPFHTDVSGAILYHHEHADGTGPFQKTWQETPLFARIIHLADMVDIIGNSRGFSGQQWKRVEKYLNQNKGRLFDEECVSAFFAVFDEQAFLAVSGNSFEEKFWKKIPREKIEIDYEKCEDIANFFAQIIDYKSKFTSRHSMGVAQKAAELARYMGYDTENIEKMYLAGALHDIGKMAIGNEILEKPDKLTDEEFAKMKNHAGYTYLILSEIDDFTEIRDWAALHHEKLNGKGYPFGKTAEELNEPERMMACIDIYQALTEERPYKKGKTHEAACEILEDMASNGWLDSRIVENIRKCFG